MSTENEAVPLTIPEGATKSLRDLQKTLGVESSVSQENKTVQIPINLAAAKSAPKLKDEMEAASREELDEIHHMANRCEKIVEMSIAFHERLLLIAVGSIAFTLTFLAYLRRSDLHGSPIRGVGLLYSAWLFLLLCVVLSWIHNLARSKSLVGIFSLESAKASVLVNHKRHLIMERTKKIFENSKTPEIDLGQFFTDVSAFFKAQSDKSVKSLDECLESFKRAERKALRMGGLGWLCIIIAFVLLMIFTLKNLALL
jgi:hypothetical protein